MSGPKSADYYLTPEQRRQLAEQRRVNELKNKIKKYALGIVYSQSDIDEYSSHAAELLEVMSTDNGYSELSEQFGTIMDKLKSAFKTAEILNTSSSLSECYENIRKLKAKKDSVLTKMKVADSQNILMLKTEYAHRIESVMDTDFGDIKSKKQSEFDELFKWIMQRFAEIRCIPNLSGELYNEIDSVENRMKEFTDIFMLKNFEAITVETLADKCREYSEIYTEYEELYAEYQALCESDEIISQQLPCSRESIGTLKKLISDVHLAIEKSDEQEYISRSIDEVMMEMGYKLIGDRSVTKKNGRKFYSELYTFSEGTAVNITRTSNGQITMELAGIDTADRQPTDIETSALCAEMESFCGAFSEFEKRLAKKGVISKHISILPPTSEYAQIINVNDYEVCDTADYSELRRNKNTGTEKSKRME